MFLREALYVPVTKFDNEKFRALSLHSVLDTVHFTFLNCPLAKLFDLYMQDIKQIVESGLLG